MRSNQHWLLNHSFHLDVDVWKCVCSVNPVALQTNNFLWPSVKLTFWFGLFGHPSKENISSAVRQTVQYLDGPNVIMYTNNDNQELSIE